MYNTPRTIELKPFDLVHISYCLTVYVYFGYYVNSVFFFNGNMPLNVNNNIYNKLRIKIVFRHNTQVTTYRCVCVHPYFILLQYYNIMLFM